VADYRCYLLGLSGSILAAHEISCEDDQAAIAKAHELFDPNGFEVWRRDRRIYPTTPTTSGQDDRHSEQAHPGADRRQLLPLHDQHLWNGAAGLPIGWVD
jgi:hypothetical protein